MAEDPSGKAGSATGAAMPPSVEVEAHLSQVLGCEIFRRSDRIKRLLSFLVKETLAGRGDRLNEYAIALEVFDRGADFDPARDTIVRVEVRRLRRKLAFYYDGPGGDSRVRIEIARGYRPEFHSSAGSSVARDRNRRWRWVVAGAAAALLGALALVAVYGFVSEPPGPVEIEPELLTTLKGLEEHPSLSPDGSQVVFAWRRENRSDYDIYVQMTDGGEPVALADSPLTEYSPAWSPDGKKIAFLQLENAHTARIVVTSPVGGATRTVARITAPISPMANPPSLAWTPDGQSLIAPDREAANEHYALYRFGVSAESKDRLTNPPIGIFGGDSSPAVSPDGGRLAFARQTTIGEFELRVGALHRPGSETVARESATIAGIAWTPGGDSLVASVGRRLRLLSLSGGARGEGFPLEGRDGLYPSVAGQSGALAYADRSRSDSDIWRLELDETGRRALRAERLISSTQGDYGARYSPNGRQIAFSSRRSSEAGIWLASADGSDITPLRGSPRGGMMVQWSPQASAVFYTARTEGVWSIWTAQLNRGKAPRRTLPLETQNACGSWSPDGRWFYFDRRVEGRGGIWRWPRAGPKMELVRDGGVCPSVSPDNRYLYFGEARVGPTRLMRAPIEGGAAEAVAPTLLYDTCYRVTERGVYYVPALDAEGNAEIHYLDFETGEKALVHRVGSSVFHGLDISPDGRYLLFTKSTPRGADLMLVEGLWRRPSR